MPSQPPARSIARLANWSAAGAKAALTPADLLSLQRTIGNSSLRRLLQSPNGVPVQRAAAINDNLHLQASLFTTSDQFQRLDAAFHNKPSLTAADNGPAVKVLQQALVASGHPMPRSIGADGELDGKWGNETSTTVQKFQSENGIEPGGFEAGRKTLMALDAHLQAVQPAPPKPIPPQPVPPQPKPPVQNQELETVMNQISIAYQLVLTRERDGVLALCRDLTNLDKPEPSLALKLLVAMLQVLAPALYGFAEGALRLTIKKAYNSALDPSDPVLSDMDNANDKVFDALFSSVPDAIGGLKQGGDEKRSDLLADFCDAQLNQVTIAGFKSLSEFEGEGKNKLRNSTAVTSTKHDPRNQSGDHRVDGALAMSDAVNQGAIAAADKRREEALHAWDSKLAQKDLGVNKLDVNDTNLDSLQNDAKIPPGVLRIAIFPALDEKSEEVISASIDGLSPRVRSKLKGKTGGNIELPIIVEGPTGSRRLRIGISEHHHVVDLTTSNSGGQWLTLRGDGDRAEGVARVVATVLKAQVPDIESR